MKYETIILEKKEGIATITLNRPEKLNAYTDQMAQELMDGLEDCNGDNNVRVLVVTGAGRAFCAGADMGRFHQAAEARAKGQRVVAVNMRLTEKLAMAFRNFRKPIIASINGPAVGIGFTLPLACDIRIASENATLGAVFVRVGLVPEFGSTYNLTRLVGMGKACELVFAGKVVNATEAKEIGLVNQVVPQEELQKTTYEMARNIAGWPPIAIQLAKRGLYQGLDSDLPSQLSYEAFALDYCQGTEEHTEAVRAFLEKRKPNFKGR